ncbi:hypothetical protein MANY_31110 [Mycolicibacterium anyangense]|uniref:Uncharacterized protein n=1 Tax=Mycolicibacterium anyangense TaxID=1431246 RepID=A0A6N4WCH5_9MYCO|nr:hypothetical protein MANY_31110 [Mycolicibacterium anyangense]
MNWVTPAPEPVGLYDRFLPAHFWPHTWLNTAIAFCCAVEPSAVSAFLPPQSAEDADEPDAPADEDDDLLLLSLPQAVNVNPVIAVADTVTRNALPKLFRFTYPTFSSSVRLGTAERVIGEVMRQGWTEPVEKMNPG